MTRIREAVIGDVPRLVQMGRTQLAATYGDAVADNPAQLEALATQLVTAPTCVCFVAEQDGAVVGMIGLVGYMHHLSGLPTAGEVMWYVAPAARRGRVAFGLLSEAETWAAETGAQVIQMIAPAGDQGARVGRLYEHRGYRHIETSYQAAVPVNGG